MQYLSTPVVDIIHIGDSAFELTQNVLDSDRCASISGQFLAPVIGRVLLFGFRIAGLKTEFVILSLYSLGSHSSP